MNFIIPPGSILLTFTSIRISLLGIARNHFQDDYSNHKSFLSIISEVDQLILSFPQDLSRNLLPCALEVEEYYFKIVFAIAENSWYHRIESEQLSSLKLIPALAVALFIQKSLVSPITDSRVLTARIFTNSSKYNMH
jgi:hypothetical protein